MLAGLIELVAEFVLQMLFALAAEVLGELVIRLKQGSPALSVIVLACAGTAAGLVSSLLFPHRLIAAQVYLPGISVLIAPVVTGFAMKLVGERLRLVGQNPIGIATFRGGLIFAFCVALIRWWLVGAAK